ncbi:hypothetical protein GLOIN_2v1543943, partial [Rhizophagus irregularis DAOM 181602=DAOM 197198]
MSSLSALRSFSILSIPVGSLIVESTNDIIYIYQVLFYIIISLKVIYPFVWMNISIIFWVIHFF